MLHGYNIMHRNIITVLTVNSHKFNLALPLTHSAVGIRTPETTGQKAANYAVFLRPSKIINMGLIRIKSFMVGCIGQSQGWPVPVAGSSNPMQPATQRFEPKSGGYIQNTGETAMRNLTQKPLTFYVSYTQPKKLLKTSRFNVFTKTRMLVLESVSFTEAVKHHPDCIIKFAGMEVVK